MKQSDDIKQVLLNYGHWGALSISVIFIIIFVLTGLDYESEKDKKDVIKKKNEVKKSLDRKSENIKEIPDYYKELQKSWEQIDFEVKTVDLNSFYPSAKINYIEGIAPTKQWINVPQDLNISIEMEKIVLKWERPKTRYNPKGEPEKMTNIDGYHLLKKWESGEKIIELSSNDTTYEDKDLETRIDYEYRIRAYTLNKEAQGGNRIEYKGQKIVVSDYTPPKQGTILPKYKIELSGVAGETAYLKLEKWEKGDWRVANFWIKKGAKIEATAKVSGYGTVRYNPGWKLLYVEPNIRKYRIQKVEEFLVDKATGEIKKDGDGKPIKVIKENKIPFYTAGIQYLDEKGEKVILFQKK